MNYAPEVPSSPPSLTPGRYTSQVAQPSSWERGGMQAPENKPSTSPNTASSIHRAPSSTDPATLHSTGQGVSPETLTDGPDVSASLSSSSSESSASSVGE
jgi:hypothetical protein